MQTIRWTNALILHFNVWKQSSTDVNFYKRKQKSNLEVTWEYIEAKKSPIG